MLNELRPECFSRNKKAEKKLMTIKKYTKIYAKIVHGMAGVQKVEDDEILVMIYTLHAVNIFHQKKEKKRKKCHIITGVSLR